MVSGVEQRRLHGMYCYIKPPKSATYSLRALRKGACGLISGSLEIALLAQRNCGAVQSLMRAATFIKVPRAHVSSVLDLTPAEWAACRGARGGVPSILRFCLHSGSSGLRTVDQPRNYREQPAVTLLFPSRSGLLIYLPLLNIGCAGGSGSIS